MLVLKSGIPKHLFSYCLEFFLILINSISLGNLHKLRIKISCQFR